MDKKVHKIAEIIVQPAMEERWQDLEGLFGPNGACAGCWCMFWRMKRTDFSKLGKEGHKALLRELTGQTIAPGVIAYIDQQPLGWCSIGPRENFIALENSRTLTRVDDQPVWSIVCFFIAREYRRQGTMLALLRGALHYAGACGARIVEAYPTDTQSPKLAGQRLKGLSVYKGIASPFRKAGFVEVGRAPETQLIMRYTIQK
jgi:GNAT superfamily N-acetyltransferase